MRAQLLTATGLAAAVFAVQAPPAQAQSAPSGSYERSCSNIRVASGQLSADCPTDNGQYRSSSIRYQDCRGDITNRNGLLSCSGATASTGTQDALGQIAGAIIGGLLGQQPGAAGQPLYQQGYRYPNYGQPGYGDSRLDPRFGSDGWGYGRDRQWVPITDRRAWFDARVDAGVRQGRLSSREPADLRRQFDDLARLETQFARGGLTNSERIDLDTRFDQLAARIQITGSGDWNSGGSGGSSGYGLESRRADFERAVDDGQRRNRITRTEAARLRADFEDLIDREADYARNGIDRNEQAELDRRYDDLVARAGGSSSGGGSGGNWSGPTVASRADALDAQIETQRRAGRLSRTDAARLGDELDTLVRLEQDYARNGLTRQEGEELERRYQDIVSRVPGTSGVITPAVLGPVEERRSSLLARIDTAERNRRINRTEAQRLRTEVDDLLRMEQDYARDGLSAGERSYLENRLNGIEALVPR